MNKTRKLRKSTNDKHLVTVISPPENGKPLHATKYGRNEPCRCGSGKKTKNCHGTETKYFIKKK